MAHCLHSKIATVKHFLFILSCCLASQWVAAQTTKPSLATGKQVYTKYCLSCHQADGRGVSGLNPPLVKTKWVLGDKNTLINIVLRGMDAPIEIQDESYNNTMPAHSHLTDQEIADVLTYVRSNFGNKASAISVKEVKTARNTK